MEIEAQRGIVVDDITERAKALTEMMTVEERASQLRYDAPEIEHLSIPRYNWWNEGLHGVARSGTATLFPQAIAMAATFDEALARRIGDIISTEARAKYNAARRENDRDIYKGITLWSPNVNIFRDPRWGRGQETYGEDPFLTSRMGVAFIRGLQGDGKYMKAAACAKHFAAYSGPEDLRHEFDAKVSKQDLWMTYLPAFEACVTEAKVEAVMGAYNRVNGEPCCAHTYLIHDILRERWGFDGHFVSDCWAIRDFHESHHVTDTPMASAALALKKGCDLNCGNTYLVLLQSLQNNLITEEEISRACTRVMRTRLRLGMFADDCEYDRIPYDVVGCATHREISIQAAEESLVLLKNEKEFLPLAKDRASVAVIGPNADSRWPLMGNYHGTAPAYVTIREGVAKIVSGNTRIYYAEGCHTMLPQAEELALPDDRITEAVTVAKQTGFAIVCVGLDERYEGEQRDISNPFGEVGVMADKSTLDLPESQRHLLSALIDTGVDLVVVNMTGSCVNLKWLHDTTNVKAILQSWYPGGEGGLAVARTLYGDANPSGRLPVTFYEDLSQIPAFDDYSMEGRTYRYMTVPAQYPFGYGLSYTTFAYAIANLITISGGASLSVNVMNTGRRAGATIVQIYIKALDASQTVPNYSLCGFTRVFLSPKETKRVDISIPARAFEMIDEEGNRYRDSSHFRLFVGGGQPDERSVALTGQEPIGIEIEL
jgi:beta-glucosidase